MRPCAGRPVRVPLLRFRRQEQPGELVPRRLVRKVKPSAGAHLQAAQDDGVDREGIPLGCDRGHRLVGEGAAQGGFEDGRTEIFATYWIDRAEGDLDDGRYQRRLDEAKLALPDDIAIWDNQIFLDPPVLATEEGSGFRRIRRWARQFYPGDSSGNAPTGTDDTRSPTVGKLETDAS
jgi:hypothetical protein